MSAVVAGFRSTRLADVIQAAVTDALRRYASSLNNAPNIRSVTVVAKLAKHGAVRTVLVTMESETEANEA